MSNESWEQIIRSKAVRVVNATPLVPRKVDLMMMDKEQEFLADLKVPKILNYIVEQATNPTSEEGLILQTRLHELARRESTSYSVANHNNNTLVVKDDTDIPVFAVGFEKLGDSPPKGSFRFVRRIGSIGSEQILGSIWDWCRSADDVAALAAEFLFTSDTALALDLNLDRHYRDSDVYTEFEEVFAPSTSVAG